MSAVVQNLPVEPMTAGNPASVSGSMREEEGAPTIAAVPLSSLQRRLHDDPNELLQHRYLCRGGGLLLVGPTGIGKSSFSMQCMLSFSLGRPVFGISPSRPLTSVLIQAENDDDDLAEMRDGVVNGMGLNEEESAEATGRILVFREDAKTSQAFFDEVVRPLLQRHRPDLLWIDPALAYLGGDAAAQSDVTEFLRNGLHPLVKEFNCGAVVVHHTNKLSNAASRGKSSGNDFAYLGSGSAEWANWSRAVLALQRTTEPNVYELIAAKRGGRLGWRMPDGITQRTSKHIAHARGEGEIYWRDAVAQEVAALANRSVSSKSEADVLALLAPDERIEKKQLVSKCKSFSMGKDKAQELIAELIEDGKLIESKEPRAGVRPGIFVSRPPQAGSDNPVNAGYSGCSSGARQLRNNNQTNEVGVVSPAPPFREGGNNNNSIAEATRTGGITSSSFPGGLIPGSSIPPVPHIGRAPLSLPGLQQSSDNWVCHADEGATEPPRQCAATQPAATSVKKKLARKAQAQHSLQQQNSEISGITE